MSDIRDRVWQRYMKRKGYKWDGYTAPKLTPDIKSDQVLALLEVMDEELSDLWDRVRWLEGKLP